jgi:hypothetical protein
MKSKIGGGNLFGGEHHYQVGRVEIPAKKWISKSSSPVPEKIRGVLNYIPDILVKIRGSGVKFRFWTPFGPPFGKGVIF